MLTPADLILHQRLGIDADVLEQLQVRRVLDADAREILGLNGRTGSFDGILYPYLLPWHPQAVTHRLRRDHPDIENGKPKNKYLSAYGDRRHLYFALRDTALLADTTIPIVLVEAEKSALAITCAARRHERPVLALGLGGCWGWRGVIGKTTEANGATVPEKGVLPDFDRIQWTGRDVVLAFDANAATNHKVQQGRRALAQELLQRGAQVRILALPVSEGINGPDDFIGQRGDLAFFTLMDAAAEARTYDAIVRLNQRHAVLREAGKPIVITDDFDPVLKRPVLTRSTFQDFRNQYLNESIKVGVDDDGKPIFKALGGVWLAHPDRRQYEGLVMSPAGDVPGYLNLWRGFTVKPQPGSWARFQEHLCDVICSGDTTLIAYVMAWLADAVQHPERRPEVALALRGLRGTGKGIFVRGVGELFGPHYIQIANTKHLTGHFNAHLQDCIVLFADEAFWAGDKAGESVLKMLVTEPMIPIERKGHDVVWVKNLLHIILASNHEWIVPAGVDERRFCVLDISPLHQQDHAYFAAISNELAAGGLAAMLHDLLHYDTAAINLRAAPGTEALRQQKVLSLLPNERWWFDKLMSGELLPGDGWPSFVVKETLHDDYVRCLQKVGADRRATETELGMFISRMVPKVKTERHSVGDKRPRCWTLSNLDLCREAFNQATHSAHPWPEKI